MAQRSLSSILPSIRPPALALEEGSFAIVPLGIYRAGLLKPVELDLYQKLCLIQDAQTRIVSRSLREVSLLFELAPEKLLKTLEQLRLKELVTLPVGLGRDASAPLNIELLDPEPLPGMPAMRAHLPMRAVVRGGDLSPSERATMAFYAATSSSSEGGWWRVEDVAKRLGYSRQTISSARQVLKQRGWIQSNQLGVKRRAATTVTIKPMALKGWIQARWELIDGERQEQRTEPVRAGNTTQEYTPIIIPLRGINSPARGRVDRPRDDFFQGEGPWAEPRKLNPLMAIYPDHPQNHLPSISRALYDALERMSWEEVFTRTVTYASYALRVLPLQVFLLGAIEKFEPASYLELHLPKPDTPPGGAHWRPDFKARFEFATVPQPVHPQLRFSKRPKAPAPSQPRVQNPSGPLPDLFKPPSPWEDTPERRAKRQRKEQMARQQGTKRVTYYISPILQRATPDSIPIMITEVLELVNLKVVTFEQVAPFVITRILTLTNPPSHLTREQAREQIKRKLQAVYQASRR